jgi:hypothetical protein
MLLRRTTEHEDGWAARAQPRIRRREGEDARSRLWLPCGIHRQRGRWGMGAASLKQSGTGTLRSTTDCRHVRPQTFSGSCRSTHHRLPGKGSGRWVPSLWSWRMEEVSLRCAGLDVQKRTVTACRVLGAGRRGAKKALVAVGHALGWRSTPCCATTSRCESWDGTTTTSDGKKGW